MIPSSRAVDGNRQRAGVPESVDPDGQELWPPRPGPECSPYRETFLAQLSPENRQQLRTTGELVGTALVCYHGPYCDEDYGGALRGAVGELYHVADYLGGYLGGELEAHVLDDRQALECMLGQLFAHLTIELGNRLVRSIAELSRCYEEGSRLLVYRDDEELSSSSQAEAREWLEALVESVANS